MFLKNLILLSFLLFIGASLFSQEVEENVIIEHFKGLSPSTSVNQILVDKSNRKLIATQDGLYRVGKFEENAEQLFNQEVSTVRLGRKGEVWYASKNVVFRESEMKKYNCPEGTIINDILVYKGQLFCGTTNGVYIFNAKSGKLTDHKTSENSKLWSNVINFLHEDKFGHAWVGTEKGVLRFDDKSWDDKRDGKKESFLIVKEDAEAVWTITDKEFWFIFDGWRWNPLGLEDDWFRGSINDFTFDSKGRLYLASDVLTRVDPNSEKIEMYSDDLALVSKKCITIASDVNNQIWIGTEKNGLYRIRFSDNEAELLSAVCILENEIKCAGADNASIVVNASGGQRPYKYKWSKNSMRGKNPKRVKPGSYAVTVTDKNKMEFVASIEITEPEAIKLNIDETQRISDKRLKDGYARISAMGGTGNLKAKWSNGEIGFEAKKLSKGNHEVTVTDASGCNVVETVEIKREKFIPDLDVAKISVGQTLRINELFFDADSSLIRSDSYDVLDEVHEFLSSNSEVVIEIGGHTNTIPSHEYCDRLSLERAENVARYLYEKGIEKKRIDFKGYGKRQPISKGTNFSARQKNQRVEIKILSLGNP